MKAYLTLVVVLVAASAEGFWLSSEPKANYCGKYECPEYTVVEKFEGYELRHYGSLTWVRTPITVMDGVYFHDNKAIKPASMKLLRYIQGANERNLTINTTIPVVVTHTRESAELCFLLPSSLVRNPPKPTEADVTLYTRNEANLYVRQFGGYPYGMFGSTNYFKVETPYLFWDLMRDEQSFNTEMFFTAVYDSTWKIFNRRNEIWYLKA